MASFSADLKKILSYSPITGRSFPVDSRIKSRHTANEVLKQAGLEKQF